TRARWRAPTGWRGTTRTARAGTAGWANPPPSWGRRAARGDRVGTYPRQPWDRPETTPGQTRARRAPATRRKRRALGHSGLSRGTNRLRPAERLIRNHARNTDAGFRSTKYLNQ